MPASAGMPSAVAQARAPIGVAIGPSEGDSAVRSAIGSRVPSSSSRAVTCEPVGGVVDPGHHHDDLAGAGRGRHQGLGLGPRGRVLGGGAASEAPPAVPNEATTSPGTDFDEEAAQAQHADDGGGHAEVRAARPARRSGTTCRPASAVVILRRRRGRVAAGRRRGARAARCRRRAAASAARAALIRATRSSGIGPGSGRLATGARASPSGRARRVRCRRGAGSRGPPGRALGRWWRGRGRRSQGPGHGWDVMGPPAVPSGRDGALHWRPASRSAAGAARVAAGPPSMSASASRPRKQRDFTVPSATPSTCAASATGRPCMSTSTSAIRCPSGSRARASRTSRRVSTDAWWSCRSGRSSSPRSPARRTATFSRRSRSRQALTTMRCSQVVTAASPRKASARRKAEMKASCTASAASSRLRRGAQRHGVHPVAVPAEQLAERGAAVAVDVALEQLAVGEGAEVVEHRGLRRQPVTTTSSSHARRLPLSSALSLVNHTTMYCPLTSAGTSKVTVPSASAFSPILVAPSRRLSGPT